MIALLVWIGQNSSFEIPNPAEYPLPVITFISQEAIHFMVTKKELEEDTVFSVRAVYISEKNAIYFSNNIELNTLSFEALFIHELVHHIQNVNDVSYPCRGYLEKAAYNLEIEYLTQNGIKDPYDSMNLNRLSLIFITQCYIKAFR
jgi:hypothetical protein